AGRPGRTGPQPSPGCGLPVQLARVGEEAHEAAAAARSGNRFDRRTNWLYGRTVSEAGAGELQEAVMAFVRAFGLHRPDETPCRTPVPPSEAHALTVLAAGEPLTQTALAARLALRKSTVSRLVDQLAARGWVERPASPDDARCRLGALTP